MQLTMQFHVQNMTCGGCARAVRAAILELDAGARIETDPPSRSVTVETSAPDKAVRKALTEAGFAATAG